MTRRSDSVRTVVRCAATLVALGACASLDIPPEETPYYREQLALARSAPPPAGARQEGAALREAAAKLQVRAVAEGERIRRMDDTEGLLDVESPAAQAFVARVGAAGTLEAALAGPLDLEHVLLATYARNPDVASARAAWAASVRLYDQASYLEDLLLRYAAFTRLATPRVGAAPMREAAFPYPGVVALKGEMIDREVAMAREMARMRLRDALVKAATAYHQVRYREEELAIRDEQFALADRMVSAVRARVTTGTAPQAELLEMEAELSMAENDQLEAAAALASARGELNTLLARDPRAPIALAGETDPPQRTPELEALLALAKRYSQEARVARARAEMTATAIRMAEAMLFAAPSPGAVAQGAPMGGTVAMGGAMGDTTAGMPSGAPSSGGADGAMGGAMGPAAGAAAPTARGLPARGAAPSGAPGAFGPDVAWVAELRERLVSLQRAADEAVRASARGVVQAHFALDAARRMFELSSSSTEPLSRQAVDERVRLYEAGRQEFAELLNAYRQWHEARREVALGRHEYGMAEAMLWMAAGARPEIAKDVADERSGK